MDTIVQLVTNINSKGDYKLYKNSDGSYEYRGVTFRKNTNIVKTDELKRYTWVVNGDKLRSNTIKGMKCIIDSNWNTYTLWLMSKSSGKDVLGIIQVLLQNQIDNLRGKR